MLSEVSQVQELIVAISYTDLNLSISDTPLANISSPPRDL